MQEKPAQGQRGALLGEGKGTVDGGISPPDGMSWESGMKGYNSRRFWCPDETACPTSGRFSPEVGPSEK